MRQTGVINMTMNDNGRLKSLNLYGLPNASVGNGLLSKVNVNWIEDTCYDELGNPYTCYSRQDERFYYIKDHLGSTRLAEGFRK